MFITFEGIEGAGKTTIMSMLGELLENAGKSTLLTREPGASSLGRKLRPLLLDARTRGLCPKAELFLFMADRSQHLEEVVRPALEAGQIVLCDRYADSTFAYQGFGRGNNLDDLIEINRLATDGLMPDLTFLLDLPPTQGVERAWKRNIERGIQISEGKFDSESMDFHERVRNGYLKLAERNPHRIKIIDATAPPARVVGQCASYLSGGN